MIHNPKKTIKHVQYASLNLMIPNKKPIPWNVDMNTAFHAGHDFSLIKLKVMGLPAFSQNVLSWDAILLSLIPFL